MKKMITAIMLLSIFTACSKKEDLQTVQKTYVTGQLLSYNSNTAISGAIINSKKCINEGLASCITWDHKTSFSAADGSFSVQRDYLKNLQVHSPGYWSYIDEEEDDNSFLATSVPRGSIQYTHKNGILEKIVVDLIPEVKVNVHVKNTSAINDYTSVYFVAEVWDRTTANPIHLRKGIDTTFEYTAFGNLSNRFSVKKTFMYLVLDSTICTKEVFPAANNSTSLDINF